MTELTKEMSELSNDFAKKILETMPTREQAEGILAQTLNTIERNAVLTFRPKR